MEGVAGRLLEARFLARRVSQGGGGIAHRLPQRTHRIPLPQIVQGSLAHLLAGAATEDEELAVDRGLCVADAGLRHGGGSSVRRWPGPGAGGHVEAVHRTVDGLACLCLTAEEVAAAVDGGEPVRASRARRVGQH